jgi:hypothetical protein
LTEPRRYLFVLTRDLAVDPSAQYLLRRALAAARRGAAVTVVLRDRATGCLAQAGELALVARLLASSVTLLTQQIEATNGAADLLDAAGISIGTLSEDGLADLLLDPAVESHWC